MQRILEAHRLAPHRIGTSKLSNDDEVKADIIRLVAENNDQPKLFVWTANPKRILAAVKRRRKN